MYIATYYSTFTSMNQVRIIWRLNILGADMLNDLFLNPQNIQSQAKTQDNFCVY